jgi:hypothetical protein
MHRTIRIDGDGAIEVPAFFEGDGCTWAPDWLPACGDIRECCRGHDYLYRRGGSDLDRAFADNYLHHCILRRARLRGHPVRGWIVAHIYYHAVRVCGFTCFQYHDTATPPGVLQRVYFGAISLACKLSSDLRRLAERIADLFSS